MFERFTQSARDVTVRSQEAAVKLNHNYIGTEHMLLGLTADPEWGSSQVLEEFGVGYDRVLAEVREVVGEGEEPVTGQIPFTPRAKKVMEGALREALSNGHNYIGTEHLLLSVAREGEGQAAHILDRLDVPDVDLREATVRHLMGQPKVDRGAEKVPPQPQQVEPSRDMAAMEEITGAMLKGSTLEVPSWVWAWLLDRRIERRRARRIVEDTLLELADEFESGGKSRVLFAEVLHRDALIARVLNSNPDIEEAERDA